MDTLLLIYLHAFFIGSFFGVTYPESPCLNIDLNGSIMTKQDTVLKGHVRRSLSDVSSDQCSIQCQREHWCISINLQIIPNTGECELNDYGVQDEMSMSKDGGFERRPGFVYIQLRPVEGNCHDKGCQNGGKCKIDYSTSRTFCACSPGYQGDRCEQGVICKISADHPYHNPCQNGGACTDQVNGYNCTCVAGFNGLNCETNVNECSHNPCQNGGACTDQVNGYNCKCVAGFNGKNCETNINECSSNPCQNGGTCTDQVNGYNCTCVAGFNGLNCETNIKECSSNPCQNGGTCTDQVNGYNCTCVAGFNGLNCETNIGKCPRIPCQNGGTCKYQANEYTCACVAGFNGLNCETSENGGT